MQIKTTAVHMELTPAIEDYVGKRLSSIDKFITGIPLVEVTLSKSTAHHRQGDIFIAKVSVVTPLGKELRAESEKPDLYEAIDDVRTEITRELTSAKGKRDSMFRRGARRVKNILKGFR